MKSHSRHLKINARRSNYSIKKKSIPYNISGLQPITQQLRVHWRKKEEEREKLDDLKCIIQAKLSNTKHLKLMRFYQNIVISTE